MKEKSVKGPENGPHLDAITEAGKLQGPPGKENREENDSRNGFCEQCIGKIWSNPQKILRKCIK